MILLAKNKYKANWVINSDANEFWYTSTANLKTELKQTRANTLICKAKNVYHEEGTPFYSATRCRAPWRNGPRREVRWRKHSELGANGSRA